MRVFVAIEITSDKIINSISKFQSEININAKPVELHNLHFTLQFLGEISQDVIEKIIVALKSVKFSKFMVDFKGIGVFPKLKFPRIVWIGTDEKGGKLLTELAKNVENVLLPLGFTVDKPFKPHITVFRIKNKIGDIEKELNKFKLVDFGTQEITGFKLKQSVLSSKGPVYSDLIEVKAE
ncbi:RNA 2',3'-cyclic phosphodiesterase [Nitrosarchaeum sp. AC2]|uniref:RNA 2',3'-cyclic phosphodiesterase n=1 Tax=Nitrosarchaeum sp. AC2 TaxID=2259673 RepID=UPI0015C6B4A0|nr:RNA 2',3'-cyclic phosphodiesterase [Nitrosarchaeum sp. AC2]QLH11742.1 RNA 2',3'-cyclic phosphodiesterase [Nitrosarchaeum sp. AC2]